MTAFPFGTPIQPANNVLVSDDDWVCVKRTFRAEEAMKLGHLVKKGTASDQVLKAGADEEKALGFVYAVWGGDATLLSLGNKKVAVGTAVAAGDLVEVAYFQSGIEFVGLLPNGVTTAPGEKLKAAAGGRLTNIGATATADEILATYAVAQLAVTAGADDAAVLLRCY